MAGGDQIADHIQPGGGQEQLPEQPPPQVPKPELQRRIVIMFSGKTGTVVRSGDVAATSAPTYRIIIDIFEEMTSSRSARQRYSTSTRSIGLAASSISTERRACWSATWWDYH